MRPLTRDVLQELLKGDEPPCVSPYRPTHRANPDSLQDPIRSRNLVRDVEQSLREKDAGREIGPQLEPFRALADDSHFWRHQRDGLAVLASTGRFEVFPFQRSESPRIFQRIDTAWRATMALAVRSPSTAALMIPPA